MAKPSKVEVRVRERRDALTAELAEVDEAWNELQVKRATIVENIALLDNLLDVPADEGDAGGDDA